MLKRTPFKRKVPAAYVKPERKPQPLYALTRPFNGCVITGEVNGQPKADLVRSEPYRRLVAKLPCIHCGIVGHSQAAHADEGKGGHIKSSDLTCYPACGPRTGVIGCHTLIGSTGAYTRDERRTLEVEYGIRTRQMIRKAGNWPKNIPHLEEQLELENV